MNAERDANAVIPAHPFHWFPEFWKLNRKRLRPQARLLALSLLVGIIAGLGAIVFFTACETVAHYTLDAWAGYRPTPPGGEKPMFVPTDRSFHPALLLIIPTLGGLLSGLVIFTLAPEAEGHGTDSAIAAYHYGQGVMRPIIPLVKIVASALTLGTGGSGGREGPIAQIGAGFGSYLGGILRLRPVERRTLLAAGMGSGVAAIFGAPVAGALFAAEVLYRSPDFESEVIIPAGLASVAAYCTFCTVFGWSPLFAMPASLSATAGFKDPRLLLSYTLLVFFMVILAMIYTRTFYGLTYLFRRMTIRPHFRPAIGAFLSALIALGLYYLLGQPKQVLAVLGFGYGVLQEAMTSHAAGEDGLGFAAVLLAVAIGKILTTSLTIGSGGSGGVFGPSMVIGGCAGGALGLLLNWVSPHLAPHPSNFVIVGMAGFFAAAAKTPFSTLVIVSEMTGNYNLLLPALWVCLLAFLLSDEQSIYSSQVDSRSRSPAHQGDYAREILTELKATPFIVPIEEVACLRPGDRLSTVIQKLSDAPLQVLPVTDSKGAWLGVLSLEEVHLATRSPDLANFLLATDLLRADVSPLHADDRLDHVAELFVENNLIALPVVDRSPDRMLIGMVKRIDVATAYLRHLKGSWNATGAVDGVGSDTNEKQPAKQAEPRPDINGGG